ncbi:MAG: glycosyltransferase [Gemmataceae bacterium]|nr:glycosyltransferase [Gemmata sp.]MDW8199235.1 glycosyltransferase [Gemmataceae bacterium]
MNTPLYVEVTALLPRHFTGIGRFIARLLIELAEQTPLRLTATIDRDTAARWNVRTTLCGRDIPLTAANRPRTTDLRTWVDELLALPSEPHNPAHARQCSMLYTYLRPPTRHYRRELAIVYDFTPILLPQFQDEHTRRNFAASFRALPLCDTIFAISEATKRDATLLTTANPASIWVQYPGPSQCVHDHAHPGPLRRRDDLIVVVATLEPRKNAQFVLDWFLHSRVVPPQMKLCWVGPPGWMPAWGQPPPISDRVLFPGVVSDAALCRLYREATFTIYPSLYEGFGFPVLDSLWHGCPVACSYNSALMEFQTPGVYYFDPGDASTLDEACRQLLAEREALVIANHDLRQRFSWSALAQAVRRAAGGEVLACAS